MTFSENCRILGLLLLLLLLLLLFLPHILVSTMDTKYEAFKACIFGSIGIRSIGFVKQACSYYSIFQSS